VDGRVMILVHTALRRELWNTGWTVASAGHGERSRLAARAGHVLLLLGMLEYQHAAEDELLWPLLAGRAAAETAPLLDLMKAQHEGLDGLISRCRAAARDWQADGGHVTADRLTELLIGLDGRLAEHFDADERYVLPLAAEHLAGSEWLRIGRAAVRRIPVPQLPLVFGMLAHQAGDPEVLRMLLHEAPPLTRMLMSCLGAREYARRARQVFSGVQP